MVDGLSFERLGLGDADGASPLLVLHAIQSLGEAGIAAADRLICLAVAQRPLEHKGAHPQGITDLAQRLSHLADLLVGEHHAPAALDLAETALLFVFEKLEHHVVQDLEIVVGLAELGIELLNHVGRKLLVGSTGLSQAGLDGPEVTTNIEEALSKLAESMWLMLDSGEKLQHANRDVVAEKGRPRAKVKD